MPRLILLDSAVADLASLLRYISPGPGEYVAGFDLATDGVDVLAVCHVLAHHGASSLPVTQLDRLKQLFLVGPKRTVAASPAHPPSISGFPTLGLYGDGDRFRKLVLGPANIGWEPAAGCRPPPTLGSRD